ncbi:MAG: ATP-binding cassette domain-containing protein [Candidatus Riflebacteria bacterium]|nr:ATP-binding cassette domain-containing protein [Candidatus Riflebacteria bacterium]
MTQPEKPKSFFRKIAGLFYRFDGVEAKKQITSRLSAQKNLPAKSVKSKPELIREPVEDNAPEPTASSDSTEPREAVPAKETFPFPQNQSAAKPPFNEPEKPLEPRDFSQQTSIRAQTTQPTAETYEKPFPIDSAEPYEEENIISAGARAAKNADAAAATGIINKYDPIVSFRNVHKVFNPGTPSEFVALENVNFEIEDLPDVGEFIALIGPSGCGKSTVLNLIQGFQEVGGPTTGEILIRNKPVTGPGRDRGMIFQKYSSFPHLTVLQNVMFGLELNRENSGYSNKIMEKLSREMLTKVGMSGHEDKYPYQLSGGQQQRVAIARTLVLRPRIILMDEPFSALDEPTRIEMQQLITNLWNEVEATVFIVTHSIAEAVYLSDRIFMFKANPGRLVSQIQIKDDDIGKHVGMSPLEVQESQKFNHFLKHITDEFIRIGGTA